MSFKLLSLSKLAGLALKHINRAGTLTGFFGPHRRPIEPGNSSRTSTVAALAATDAWTQRLRQARPGEVYFAHLLLPHFPHVVRSNCTYLPWTDWDFRRSYTTVASRRLTYAQQDRCTLKKLDEMIRAFDRSAGGKRGVVIIHGDHGSRIMEVAPITDSLGQFTNDDVIAAHSTLFTVRSRQRQGQYFNMPQPISALLRDFTSHRFERAPEPKASNRKGFIIANKTWEPQRRAALPAGW